MLLKLWGRFIYGSSQITNAHYSKIRFYCHLRIDSLSWYIDWTPLCYVCYFSFLLFVSITEPIITLFTPDLFDVTN